MDCPSIILHVIIPINTDNPVAVNIYTQSVRIRLPSPLSVQSAFSHSVSSVFPSTLYPVHRHPVDRPVHVSKGDTAEDTYCRRRKDGPVNGFHFILSPGGTKMDARGREVFERDEWANERTDPE